MKVDLITSIDMPERPQPPGEPLSTELTVVRDWPHSPAHRATQAATYLVTAGTYKKICLFAGDERLGQLTNTMLTLAERYGWELQAWAVFPNHYHFIAQSLHPDNLRKFISHLHTDTASWINETDGTPGRKVWFQYWESSITFQRSFLARLNYVHQNAVHHKLVRRASEYPWCSAGWLERNAERSFVKTVTSFPCDKLRIPDDYTLELD